MRVKTIAWLIFSVATVILVILMDGGLHGGSVANRAYGVGFLVICGVLASLLFEESPELEFVARALPLLLFVLVFGIYPIKKWQQTHRPDEFDRRSSATNVRCAAEKAGVSEEDRKYVEFRMGIMPKLEDPGNAIKEIEQKLRINILPNCEFERV